MLIVCPSCASTYALAATRFGASGRRVRCAACRGEWFADPAAAIAPAAPDLCEEATWADPPVAFPEPSPRPISTVAGPPGAIGRLRRELTAPFRHATGAAVFAAVFAAVLVLAGMIAARDDIVERLPATARLYAAVGLPVNLRGLAFNGVTSRLTNAPNDPLLVVEGEIANVGTREREVAPIALRLRDAAGQTLYTWTVDPPAPKLRPGEVRPFRTRLAAPPAEAGEVLVAFAERGPATAARGGRTVVLPSPSRDR